VGFIFLASGVCFDTTNEEGQLFHTATGACVDLDPIATIFLQIALETKTRVQALVVLTARIDATDAQLEEALEATLHHLLTLGFLNTMAPINAEHDEVEPLPCLQEGVMMPQHVPLHCELAHVDWEFFLTGQIVNSPLPRFSCGRRGYASFQTGTMLLFVGSTHLIVYLCEALGQSLLAERVRQRAWKALMQRLSRLGQNFLKVNAEDAVRVARRELGICQVVVRCLAPTALCLVRSVAFCAYLRALGFPATLVIGRACFDLTSRHPFHAWVELAGQVVNDHTELQSGYNVMQRLPSFRC
jgi:hypothetical protein